FSSDPVVAILLLVGGGLIGYGAKTAGGCTSGNGLGGCSLGSPASFVATGTFMALAVGFSFVIRWLT
ncbi:MAG TPA: YeeE/YedE thiosulfate transporter family protein, partial [Solirubrobacteraceae bacterium]